MTRIGINSPDNLASVVGGATGVVQGIYETPRQHDDPRIWSFAALMSDTSTFSDWRCNDRNGGAGLKRSDAILATVGEAVERYCCSFIDWDQSVVANYRQEPSMVHPEAWAIFSSQQYDNNQVHYKRFNEETPVRLVEGRRLKDGKSVMIPACMVYIPYFAKDHETVISPSISTGMSCHQSLDEALLLGLLECIERDAFTIYWLRACVRERLGFIADGRADHLHTKHFDVRGTEYHVYDITTDIGVPTVFVASVGVFDKGTAFSVGSACRPEFFDAWLKSMIEIGQSRPYLRYKLENEDKFEVGENFKNVRNFDDHAMVYTAEPQLIDELTFCCPRDGDQDGREIGKFIPENLENAPNDSSRELGAVLERLHALGYEPVFVDLTTPDIESLGLKVVKVFVPGLQQLHGDHLAPFLGGSRLHSEWAQDYSTLKAGEVFHMPHPFP